VVAALPLGWAATAHPFVGRTPAAVPGLQWTGVGRPTTTASPASEAGPRCRAGAGRTGRLSRPDQARTIVRLSRFSTQLPSAADGDLGPRRRRDPTASCAGRPARGRRQLEMARRPPASPSKDCSGPGAVGSASPCQVLSWESGPWRQTLGVCPALQQPDLRASWAAERPGAAQRPHTPKGHRAGRPALLALAGPAVPVAARWPTTWPPTAPGPTRAAAGHPGRPPTPVAGWSRSCRPGSGLGWGRSGSPARSRDPSGPTTPLPWASVRAGAAAVARAPWSSRRPQPTPTTGLTATPHGSSWPVAKVWGLVPSRLACQIVPSPWLVQ
jgi:hypothetical protein